LLTITCNIYLFKELGQLQAMIIPMFAQLLFSLLMEHFGWLGAPKKHVSWMQITGILQMLGGVAMIRL
jgi:transporter family-2 protein